MSFFPFILLLLLLLPRALTIAAVAVVSFIASNVDVRFVYMPTTNVQTQWCNVYFNNYFAVVVVFLALFAAFYLTFVAHNFRVEML